MNVEKDLPDSICFENEKSLIICLKLEYEWRPEVCSGCKMFGHRVDKCSKTTKKKVWVPKAQPKATQPLVPQQIEENQEHIDGFITVQRKRSPLKTQTPATPVSNTFQVLASGEGMQVTQEDGEGKGLPIPNG